MGLPTIYEYGKEENQFVVRSTDKKHFLKIIQEPKRIYICDTRRYIS